MAEIIERVARAMFDADRGGAPMVDIARTALGTMRDPTEKMLNAARDWSIAKYGRGIGNDAAIGCWQAMMDAALADETPGT